MADQLSQQESVFPNEVDKGVFAKLLAVTDAGTIDVSGAWDALALERDGLRADRDRYREALDLAIEAAESARQAIVGVANGTGQNADPGQAHRDVCSILVVSRKALRG